MYDRTKVQRQMEYIAITTGGEWWSSSAVVVTAEELATMDDLSIVEWGRYPHKVRAEIKADWVNEQAEPVRKWAKALRLARQLKGE